MLTTKNDTKNRSVIQKKYLRVFFLFFFIHRYVVTIPYWEEEEKILFFFQLFFSLPTGDVSCPNRLDSYTAREVPPKRKNVETKRRRRRRRRRGKKSISPSVSFEHSRRNIRRCGVKDDSVQKISKSSGALF